MIPGSKRLRPLLLLLLLGSTFCLFTSSRAWKFGTTSQDADESNTRIAEPPFQAADQSASQDQRERIDQDAPGVSAYREASIILQKIKPPPRRLARFTKPRGILGATSQYGKEIFRFLFTNGPSKVASEPAVRQKPGGPLAMAVGFLEESANQGNEDAIFKLAQLSFYGGHTYPRNYSQAFERYKELANLTGNSTAQHMIGFMYATGIGGAVEQDQARALLYHTFAADAGNIQAQMTAAYRHHSGIATPRNCERAVHYYKKVADKAMAYVRSGPPGGQQVSKEAYRLADEEGGIFGEGASVSSSGHNAKQGGPTSNEGGAFENMLLYLDLMARKGELKATFGLGRVHYEGSRALQRDFRTAKDKFLDVARRYWTKDGKVRPAAEPAVAKIASQAAGYLGRMFLRGEGMEQNFAKAHIWFQRGIANGDALCQYSMGIMHLNGLGMEKNPVRAAEFFGAAADQDFSTAQVRLGALFMDQGNLDTAIKYFELAARNGHVEAFYYLAEIAHLGAGRDRNCNQAAHYYKIVSEKAEPIHSSFQEANDAYEDGDLETALPLFMQAAEQGYEAAQANVAYLLDKASGASRSRFARFIAHLPSYLAFSRSATDKAKSVIGDAALALIYWTRSAKQANIDSLVKMGDYYLLGLGISSPLYSSGTPDAEKALACYSAAADTLQSAQAFWNLGWMHENGLGVDQDFHLAKRYYDQCGETNKEGKAPVALALYKLRIRSAWNWFVGGDVHGIDSAPPGEDGGTKKYSLSGWIADFLAADIENTLRAEREMNEWEADQYTRDGAAADGEVMYGDEYGENADDNLLELIAILGLASALALLVWYRQIAAQREERLERERRRREMDVAAAAAVGDNSSNPQAADQVQVQRRAEGQGAVPDANRDGDNAERRARGFFPAPGDPQFPGWVAGGIGH